MFALNFLVHEYEIMTRRRPVSSVDHVRQRIGVDGSRYRERGRLTCPRSSTSLKPSTARCTSSRSTIGGIKVSIGPRRLKSLYAGLDRTWCDLDHIDRAI
jgi:hypothetical protein